MHYLCSIIRLYMPRPQNNRIVHEPPLYTDFKPVGKRASELGKVDLSLDEFEAFRLADKLNLSHAEAAEEMEISRSTFSRLIDQARGKIADFITNGKMLSISGGNVHFRTNTIKCQSCGHMFKIDINDKVTECPHCHSKDLLSLAGGFGHGRCCRQGQI